MTLDDDIDQQLARLLSDAINKKSRGYASYWEAPGRDRQLAEWGVATAFFDFAASSVGPGQWQVRHRGRGDDPPDLEATNEEGLRVGVEVTELVDREHAGGDPTDWADWTPDNLQKEIANRLERKDRPENIKGGPYEKYVVLLYTDEPMLTMSRLSEFLENLAFGPFDLIDAAWIVTSYHPHESSRCYQLEITPSPG